MKEGYKNIMKTEAELSKRDDYRKIAKHDDVFDREYLIDKQDGVLVDLVFNTKITIASEEYDTVTKIIEEWLLDKNGGNRIEISILAIDDVDSTERTVTVPFYKYYINFSTCSNKCEHWVIAKCGMNGWAKIYSKHLGSFVLNSCSDMPVIKNHIFNNSNKDIDETSFLN